MLGSEGLGTKPRQVAQPLTRSSGRSRCLERQEGLQHIVCICVCVYVYIYIYMCIERERERDTHMHVCIQ